MPILGAAIGIAVVTDLAVSQALLRDLNPTSSNNGGFNPFSGAVMQGVLYFGANRWDTGSELWRSDGTVGGTRLVADLVPGTASSFPQLFTSAGSLLFFLANATIYRTDGTEAGTFAVGPQSSGTQPVPCAAGSHVVWTVRTTSSTEVWSSDGTSSTPTLVLSMSFVSDPVSAGTRAWFSAFDPVNGRELWYTDGTVGGTARVDTIPGSNSAFPTNLCSDGSGGVWFSGNDSSHGDELWHSDGTVAGTGMVADLVPGSLGISPRNLCSLGSRVFFVGNDSVGDELYVSDGRPTGTQLVLDIAPGSASSSPQALVALPALGKVMFSATDPVAGREPWISDGTAIGTMRLMDVNPGVGNSNDGSSMRATMLGGVVWFTGSTPALGRELYRTDGTPAGTALVADLAPGPLDADPRPLGDVGTCLLFSVFTDPIGVELWQFTASASVPTLLADFHPAQPAGSLPSQARAAALGGRLHFPALEPASGVEPHKTDGTRVGTVLVGNVVAGSAGYSQLLGATSTHVFYQVADDFFGANARLVAVPADGPPVVLRNGTVLGSAVLRDKLVFSQLGTDSEPMITDGTVAGTSRIADVRPGTASSQPTPFVTLGERVFFFADNGVVGRELWVTDGTAAGTALAVDCVPGPSGSSPTILVAGPSRMFFRVTSGTTWTSDGTAVGTATLPTLPLSLSYQTMLGDLLVVSAGRELWRSDGTTAGTRRILTSDSLNPEPFRDLCVARGAVFFSMQRATTGPQLWRSDGTVAGTTLVAQLHSSVLAPAPRVAAAGLGHVACVGYTSATGAELWISDGTAAGTGLLVDAEPGPAPSNPVFIDGTGTAGRHFTWWSDTVAAGLEPWSIPLAAFGGSAFDGYGLGCGGTRGVPHIQGDGLPIVGSPRVAFQLRNALQSTFAVLLLGMQRTGNSGTCVQLNEATVTIGLFTDTAGRAEHAFAVPSVTAFVGTAVQGQFVVLDPSGGAFGLAATTGGLEALIGR